MPKILCIESSTDICSVSILNDITSSVYSKISSGLYSHAEEMTVLVRDCMEEANLAFEALDAIALSKGPGSFTALRVGASVAKAISFSQDIPLIAVETLKIIAVPYLKGMGSNDIIIPMLDARRDEVYMAVYDNKLNTLETAYSHVLTVDSFKAYNNKKVLICGNATDKAKSLLQNPNFLYQANKPVAKDMHDIALQRFRKKIFEDKAYFVPFYMKPPNITKPRKNRL